MNLSAMATTTTTITITTITTTTTTTLPSTTRVSLPPDTHPGDLHSVAINWTMQNSNSSSSSNSSCPCLMEWPSNQSCCHGYRIPPEFILPPPLSSETLALLTSLYALVVVGALLGNLVVIVVVVWGKMLRSFTDAFILSLAVSDLLVAGFNMPLRLLGEVWNEWRLGVSACRLTEYLQGVTIVNNILTLTAIAIDRYLVICHEQLHRRINRRKRTLIGLMVVWLLSLVVVTPQLFMTQLDMRIKRDPSSLQITGTAWVCVEVLSNQDRRVYTLTIYVCVYVLPMLVIGYTYSSIAQRLWHREGNPSQTPPANPRPYPQSRVALARRRHVTVMMITLVLAFTVLWLPFFSASLYLEFQDHQDGVRFRTARDFLQLVGYSTCCINPVIYTFFNRHFQDNLCALCCRPQHPRVAPAVLSVVNVVPPSASPALARSHNLLWESSSNNMRTIPERQISVQSTARENDTTLDIMT